MDRVNKIYVFAIVSSFLFLGRFEPPLLKVVDGLLHVQIEVQRYEQGSSQHGVQQTPLEPGQLHPYQAQS